MSDALAFSRLLHADWGKNPKKRWLATADHAEGRWTIRTVEPVGPSSAFLERLLDKRFDCSLVGFDFPIGAAIHYGVRTGLNDFPSLLTAIGSKSWDSFTLVADSASEIETTRPFFPGTPRKGVKLKSLLDAHGASVIDDLLRRCERATPTRRAACSLFWTLGGNQVGRGALAGWIEIIKPAMAAGASLWPFDGGLPELVSRGGLVLAETYPAEAYHHIGVQFASKESKTCRADRQRRATAITGWAERYGVQFEETVMRQIEDGFGHDRAGEDRFDALLGLCGMIEVASGRRADGAARDEASLWEGWILGQQPG